MQVAGSTVEAGEKALRPLEGPCRSQALMGQITDHVTDMHTTCNL